MTSTFEMGHFLTRKHFGEFDNNINSKAIMKLLGKPHQVESYANGDNFFHYGNIRLWVRKDRLTEIGLFFVKDDATYNIEVDGEIVKLCKHFSLLDFLNLMNQFRIKGEIPYQQSTNEHLLIIAES